MGIDQTEYTRNRSARPFVRGARVSSERRSDPMANQGAEAARLAEEKARLDGTDEPDLKQLAEAEVEAEKALKEMERQGGGDSTLSKYFREMAYHRVLTPQEEIEAAQEVERLEIAYWEALFSYAPA